MADYLARALNTDQYAHNKSHNIQEVDYDHMLAEASDAVHQKRRRASQMMLSVAAEMSVEARLQAEFNVFMMQHPLDPDLAKPAHPKHSGNGEADKSGSYAGTVPDPCSRRASTDMADWSRQRAANSSDAEEAEAELKIQQKRLAQQMVRKSRRQSFLADADTSTGAAGLLGKLRGLRDYSVGGAGEGSHGSGEGDATGAAGKHGGQGGHRDREHKEREERKVLNSAARANPALKNLMHRSRLLGDLDDSSDDEAEGGKIPSALLPYSQHGAAEHHSTFVARSGRSASSPVLPAVKPPHHSHTPVHTSGSQLSSGLGMQTSTASLTASAAAATTAGAAGAGPRRRGAVQRRSSSGDPLESAVPYSAPGTTRHPLVAPASPRSISSRPMLGGAHSHSPSPIPDLDSDLSQILGLPHGGREDREGGHAAHGGERERRGRRSSALIGSAAAGPRRQSLALTDAPAGGVGPRRQSLALTDAPAGGVGPRRQSLALTDAPHRGNMVQSPSPVPLSTLLTRQPSPTHYQPSHGNGTRPFSIADPNHHPKPHSHGAGAGAGRTHHAGLGAGESRRGAESPEPGGGFLSKMKGWITRR